MTGLPTRLPWRPRTPLPQAPLHLLEVLVETLPPGRLKVAVKDELDLRAGSSAAPDRAPSWLS